MSGTRKVNDLGHTQLKNIRPNSGQPPGLSEANRRNPATLSPMRLLRRMPRKRSSDFARNGQG
jgi:hypothetical protein